MSILDAALNAYKKKSETSIVTIVFLLIGLITLIWFQTMSVPNLNSLFNLAPGTGKRLVLEYAMNLFSGVFLIGVSISWAFFVFKDESWDRYNYYDDNNLILNKAVYGITALLLFIAGASFIVYLISKMAIVLILVIIGIGYFASKK